MRPPVHSTHKAPRFVQADVEGRSRGNTQQDRENKNMQQCTQEMHPCQGPLGPKALRGGFMVVLELPSSLLGKLVS